MFVAFSSLKRSFRILNYIFKRFFLEPTVLMLLLILAAGFFLPGIERLPPMDRDETRFAQASKQMMETGNYGSIFFQEKPRYKKPIGIYWLQVISVKITQLLGVTRAMDYIWVYRLPSVVSAVLCVGLIYWIARAFMPLWSSALAGLFYVLLLLAGVEARLAKTDSALNASILLIIGALAHLYQNYRRQCRERAFTSPLLLLNGAQKNGLDPVQNDFQDRFSDSLSQSRKGEVRRLLSPPTEKKKSLRDFKNFYIRLTSSFPPSLVFVFWTGLSIGILLKGPVIFYFFFFIVLGLTLKERNFSWLAPLMHKGAILWALILCVPWFIFIIFKSDFDFLRESLNHDLLKKIQSGQESHGAPSGTYSAVFLITAWPMSAFLGPVLRGLWEKQQELFFRPIFIFLLSWLLPAWLLLELVPTKLPHYVLPLYPALAILFAYILSENFQTQRWRGDNLFSRINFSLVPLVPFLFFLGLLIGGFYLELSLSAEVIASSLGAVSVGAIAYYCFWKKKYWTALLFTSAASFLMQICFYVYFLGSPAVEVLNLSQRLAAYTAVPFSDSCRNPLLASSGFHEPSLIFLTRTDIRLLGPEEAAAFLKTAPCRLAFIEDKDHMEFKNALGDFIPVERKGAVEGWKMNGGRKVVVYVYGRSD